jgi:hypothetical protein
MYSAQPFFHSHPKFARQTLGAEPTGAQAEVHVEVPAGGGGGGGGDGASSQRLLEVEELLKQEKVYPARPRAHPLVHLAGWEGCLI